MGAFCQRQGGYITGSMIRVDGGRIGEWFRRTIGASIMPAVTSTDTNAPHHSPVMIKAAARERLVALRTSAVLQGKLKFNTLSGGSLRSMKDNSIFRAVARGRAGARNRIKEFASRGRAVIIEAPA